MAEFHDRRQPPSEDEGERNFEVHGGMLHVGGRPFPLARVYKGESRENGYIQHVQVPTEGGWVVHGHLLYDNEDRPRGNSGHVLGEMTIMHHPTLKAGHVGKGLLHQFPEDEPNVRRNTYGDRVLKVVHTPEDFHGLVRYASRLPGSSEPRYG